MTVFLAHHPQCGDFRRESSFLAVKKVFIMTVPSLFNSNIKLLYFPILSFRRQVPNLNWSVLWQLHLLVNLVKVLSATQELTYL